MKAIIYACFKLEEKTTGSVKKNKNKFTVSGLYEINISWALDEEN